MKQTAMGQVILVQVSKSIFGYYYITNQQRDILSLWLCQINAQPY